MRIMSFEPDSTAQEAGLQIGDVLSTINGHPCRDIIDYQFHATDEELELEILRDGETFIFEIEKEFDDSLGIIFEDTKYRCCGNKCIFCFIDQNPENLRQALYFKDEDFRLSFLYGNYVTLTNVSKRDLERIVEQRLSPLYISVHSTDLDVRKLMLGIKNDDKLMDKIQFLTHHQIELHAQIVLCPGINDGQVLEKTIHELSQFYPNLKSIAIVPVGLTRHRENLYQINPVDKAFSINLINQIEPLGIKFKNDWDDYFVYLSDEFYILAEREIPQAERYEEFPQIENGVGMMREFIDQFKEQKQYLPHKISQQHHISLVSGKSAGGFIESIVLPELQKIENLSVSLHIIKNQFYGESVTVTGLLTGQDIYNQLKEKELGNIIVLPENCLNFEGLFLDDWTPEMLAEKLGKPVKFVLDDFEQLIEELN